MLKKKIAVLVSGGGTNLQALIDAQKRGELGAGEITLVIASKPGVYALERAAQNGIESKVLARKDYGSIAEYSRALADALTESGIDLVGDISDLADRTGEFPGIQRERRNIADRDPSEQEQQCPEGSHHGK